MLSGKLREHGVVGAGGAGFPTQVKAQSQVEFVIANGAECEPLIHKDADNDYGVSFPDIPGAITGGDTIDEAMQQAAEILQFASEDWTNADGSTGFKPPSTIDELRGSIAES